MVPPPGWPFSSYLDFDRMLQAEEPLRLLALDMKKCLDAIEDFLHGNVGFDRPLVFSRTQVGFTATPWLGARSRRTIPPTGYAISVDAGAHTQLLVTVLRLLAHPATLPLETDGNITKLERQLSLPQILPTGVRVLFGDDAKSPNNFDGDRARYACANQLVLNGMLFLFLHELAHVERGHIDFEVTRKLADDPLSSDERRSLEFMADARAVTLAAHFYCLHIGLDQDERGALRNLRLFGFAIGVVFLLLEHLPEGDHGRSVGKYPPASWRRLFVRAVAAGSTADYFRLSHAEVAAAISEGVAEAQAGWHALGWGSESDIPANLGSIVESIIAVEQLIHQDR
jgi:hypothetical protein